MENSKARLLRYNSYYGKYYNDALREGQGVEYIFDMLQMISSDHFPIWLDLGSGSATPFWSIGLSNFDEIWCIDKTPEAFTFLFDLLLGREEIPLCYLQTLNHFNKPKEHVENTLGKITKLDCFDALSTFPKNYTPLKFKLISQFGMLGLLSDLNAYFSHIDYILKFIDSGGYFIGANWTRSIKYSMELGGIENGYLKKVPRLIRTKIPKVYDVIYCKYVEITDDPYYEGVLIWCIRSMSQNYDTKF